jgi:poly-gamma-glutamate synthesis protein (capsule biosynthesis protein)
VRLALAGDTMLGRRVADALVVRSPERLVADGVRAHTAAADAFVLNLECCISERGEPWPDPQKPFFFRAPPAAVDLLASMGVDCVSLANNHALDFGSVALLDTIDLLEDAGIAHVGAGCTQREARRPAVLERDGFRLAVFAVTDHPRAYAARRSSPGVAFAALDGRLPRWLETGIAGADADAVLVMPHWGPNMTPEPVSRVRTAARALAEAGATLVAGHSAHVFHGVDGRVLYDLGDFLDDYRVDPELRNDLGLLFLVRLGVHGPEAIEAIPLKLDYCSTRLAMGAEAAWIASRLRALCAPFGVGVVEEDDRIVLRPPR